MILNRIAVWRSHIEEHEMNGQLRNLTERNPLGSGYRLIQDALPATRDRVDAKRR